ncbi:DUF1559 domain-containing protein [Bremerella sp. JC817]|uniref:DUF1559 family PulG-like putative transporter n=1 Tax=Bremerella sp. JC817 TaxID=3231756 RepID=UPI00345B3FBD
MSRPIIVGAFLLAFCVGCEGREAARAKQTAQIFSYAIPNYRDTFLDAGPPIVVADQDGNLLHSWRSLLIPFVMQNSFFDEYDLTTAWDSPQNQDLADGTRRLDTEKGSDPASVSTFYREPRTGDSRDTIYVALVQAPLEAKPYGGRDADGHIGYYLPQGIPMVVLQLKQSDIHWMEPCDVALFEKPFPNWLSLADIQDQIVRSFEVGSEVTVRERDETLRFLEQLRQQDSREVAAAQ